MYGRMDRSYDRAFLQNTTSGLAKSGGWCRDEEVNASSINDPDPSYSSLYPETSSMGINPGLSVGGTKNFTDQFSMGLWLGRAQRSGSMTERFINYFPVGEDPYEMVGNPLIDPEVNNQADLNFRWEANQTVLQLDLFVAYMQDFISSSIDTTLSPKLPSSPGVRRYQNIDKAFKTGSLPTSPSDMWWSKPEPLPNSGRQLHHHFRSLILAYPCVSTRCSDLPPE